MSKTNTPAISIARIVSWLHLMQLFGQSSSLFCFILHVYGVYLSCIAQLFSVHSSWANAMLEVCLTGSLSHGQLYSKLYTVRYWVLQASKFGSRVVHLNEI